MWLPVMMYVSVHVVVVVTSLAGLKPANFFVLSTTAEKVGGRYRRLFDWGGTVFNL